MSLVFLRKPSLAKARIPGGAVGDLFDSPVRVQGHVRGHTLVRPYVVHRKVRREAQAEKYVREAREPGSAPTYADWHEWSEQAYQINQVMAGELRAGERDSQGEPVSAAEVESLQAIGAKIQAAAERGRIPGGVSLYRGAVFASEAAMMAALRAEGGFVVPELLSTSVKPEDAAGYAGERSTIDEGSVQALLHFESGAGQAGAKVEVEGFDPGEYVLPKGAR